MTKKRLIVSIFAFLFALSQPIYADSPLTSTNISKAYQDAKIVQLAAKANGKLNKKLMKYIADSNNPIELKIAVINALGWDIDGKNNAALFYEYVSAKHQYKGDADFIYRADANDMICMAYLKALDNYFDVEDALKYARRAIEKDENSYTIHMIASLIEAQKAMDTDFCQVYQVTNQVRTNSSLHKKDMRQAAVDLIFEYINLYKGYCKE